MGAKRAPLSAQSIVHACAEGLVHTYVRTYVHISIYIGHMVFTFTDRKNALAGSQRTIAPCTESPSTRGSAYIQSMPRTYIRMNAYYFPDIRYSLSTYLDMYVCVHFCALMRRLPQRHVRPVRMHAYRVYSKAWYVRKGLRALRSDI